MVQMATPWKSPSGIYYLRRQIPERLRLEMGGGAVHKETLGTRDPFEAARLYPAANARLQARMDEAERRLAEKAQADEISAERASAIVDRWLRNRHKGTIWDQWPTLAMTWWLEDTADRLFGIGGIGFMPPVDEDEMAEGLAALQGQKLVGDKWLACVQERSRSTWIKATRMVLDPLFDSADPKVVRKQINEFALMDAWNARLVQDLERFRAAVDAPRRVNARPRLRTDLKFRELLKLWAAEKKPRPQSLAETSRAVEDMIDYLGNVTVGTMTSDMLMDYRDEAKNLPATMPRADRSLPFTQRLALHLACDTPRVSSPTLKKRLGAIQALLGYAHEQRWIEQNVGSGLKIMNYTRTTRTRRSFRDGELATLFASDLFARPDQLLARDTSVSDVTLYWLFVLCLTSGPRLEEVGQARVADVKTDNGILYIDVDDLIEDDNGSVQPDRSIKTENSRRVVPIHNRAIALGFGRYVCALRSQGQEMLFPDLKPNIFGKFTQEASRRANRYINAVLGKDRRIVFHSLRHRFKDQGRKANVQESILDQMCGHAPATVGGRYGDGVDLADVKRSLDLLTFDAIDWAMLERAAAKVNWETIATTLVQRVSSARARA